MALKDGWQALRQKRQHAVKMRRNHVNETLTNWQQQRSNQAQALREQLEDFRQELLTQEIARSQAAQLDKWERQIFWMQIEEQTQEFLKSCQQERQKSAAELAKSLQEFVRSLSAQTAKFLSISTQERWLMAEILKEDLQAFHRALSLSGSQLRQSLQVENQARKEQMGEFLLNRQQLREKTRKELTEDLINFVETLRLEIYADLHAMALLRKTRSQQLQQSFAQNRAHRAATLQKLSDRLAQFRAELADHRQQLQQDVWGTPTEGAIAPPAPTPVVVEPPPASPPASNSVPYEQEVYNYIRQVQGARLGDTESALAINRIQTVDALRSLLKKGLIAQHDRVYVVQSS